MAGLPPALPVKFTPSAKMNVFLVLPRPKTAAAQTQPVDPAGWVAPVTPGRILFEVEGVPFDIAKEALRLGAQKLPVKTKFVIRRDYDKNA